MNWKSGFKYVACYILGRLILFVCRRQIWSGLQEELFVASRVSPI